MIAELETNMQFSIRKYDSDAQIAAPHSSLVLLAINILSTNSTYAISIDIAGGAIRNDAFRNVYFRTISKNSAAK
jgi:hypothetical protein